MTTEAAGANNGIDLSAVAERLQDTPECLDWPDDGEMTCPCCGGAGEHYTHPKAPYLRDVEGPCTFCGGWGIVLIRRKEKS